LPLGATSSGEIIDFELTQELSPQEFQLRLSQQLPSNIPIYSVAVVDLKAPAATQILDKAEYLITVATTANTTSAQWQAWVAAIAESKAIWFEQQSKSGKRQNVNLRERLFELSVEPRAADAIIRYVGSCRNDGTQLRPEQAIFMLEQVAPQQEFQILHVHRQRLILEQTVSL